MILKYERLSFVVVSFYTLVYNASADVETTRSGFAPRRNVLKCAYRTNLCFGHLSTSLDISVRLSEVITRPALVLLPKSRFSHGVYLPALADSSGALSVGPNMLCRTRICKHYRRTPLVMHFCIVHNKCSCHVHRRAEVKKIVLNQL